MRNAKKSRNPNTFLRNPKAFGWLEVTSSQREGVDEDVSEFSSAEVEEWFCHQRRGVFATG